MLARAILRPQGLAFQRDDVRLDAALGEVGLHRLRDFRKRRIGQRVDCHLETIAVAGFLQQLFRCLHILLVRRVFERTPQAARPECLVHDELPGEKAIGHALVVDQVPHRLHHLVLAEDRVTRICRHVDDGAFRIAVDGDVRVALHALDLVRRQVARHVDIAFFEQQPL